MGAQKWEAKRLKMTVGADFLEFSQFHNSIKYHYFKNNYNLLQINYNFLND